MLNKRFKLFSCCLITRGVKRAIIIDIQREVFYYIPNAVIDILEEYSKKPIYYLFKDFENEKSTLKDFMRFFLNNEVVFLTDESDNFPLINNDFIKPFDLDTITIDIELLKTCKDVFSLLEIDKTGATCLRLIVENILGTDVEEILELIKETTINSIALFTKYNKNTEKTVKEIDDKNPIITQIVFYDCSRKEVLNKNGATNRYYLSESLETVLLMKVAKLNDFVINLDFYNESHLYNSPYNRTVFIDKFGNIKRYIGDNVNFGNIENTSIRKIIKMNDFREFWGITRDRIEVCKDCEFRYICPHGSPPYKEDEANFYYKTKISCNYDPYKNKWTKVKKL